MFHYLQTGSVQFSRSVMSNSLQPHGHQASLSSAISQSLLQFMPVESMMPSNHLTLCHSFSSCPQPFPGSSPVRQVFTSGAQSAGASASASALPMNLQGWSPCSPRDSRESSPAPQFRSINSLALSLLCGPTLQGQWFANSYFSSKLVLPNLNR